MCQGLQHTTPSICKLGYPFNSMIHNSDFQTFTISRSQRELHPLTRTAVLEQGWKIHPCKTKVRLSSRKTPCKLSQLPCQVFFQAPASPHSNSSTAHGEKEISTTNQSQTTKWRMPALGNGMLSLPALCTNNQSQNKQEYFGKQVFLDTAVQQSVNLPCHSAEHQVPCKPMHFRWRVAEEIKLPLNWFCWGFKS